MTRLLRWTQGLLRFLLGVVLTQSFPTAWLLSGWGQEVMRRAVLARWAHATGAAPPEACAYWPPFVMGDPGGTWRERLLGGAWRNLLRGVNALAATFIVTGPGIALMAFSWRYGWDNSFNKGYEQAYIGPTLGLSGTFLFMLAMLYVPLAQAQLALDGRRASFFRWRVIWAALRCHLRGAILLAAAYFAAALPINIFFIAVLFRFNTDATADWSDAQVLEALKGHYLLAGIVGLPLFAWVRLRAARTYADGIVRALRAGRLRPEAYAGMPAVEALALALGPPLPSRLAATLRRTLLVPTLALLLAVWFGFVAQIYIRQFLNYIPLGGWLNQPLVHAPWLRYIPKGLADANGANTVDSAPDLPPY
ncbi:MAG: hypothetical protein GC168_02525 [Candidatus Hydrogenedens sp.]|nr:hypothetical protein [Candidatus Hydrogenedens sp.]